MLNYERECFCDLFCALSNLALSLRALIVIFERVLDAISSEALLSMVIAFMSIDCDSESSLILYIYVLVYIHDFQQGVKKIYLIYE